MEGRIIPRLNRVKKHVIKELLAFRYLVMKMCLFVCFQAAICSFSQLTHKLTDWTTGKADELLRETVISWIPLEALLVIGVDLVRQLADRRRSWTIEQTLIYFWPKFATHLGFPDQYQPTRKANNI